MRPLLLLALASAVVAGEGRPGYVDGELPGARKRDPSQVYVFYAPRAYDPTQPAPLVVALHGGRGNAMQFARFLTPFAEATGSVLACPQGFEEIIGADGYWWRGSVEEMLALERFIEFAKKRYAIDPKRVTVVGLADGGELAARFALSRDREIAGLLLLNILWNYEGSIRAPKTLKVAVLASRDAEEKLAKMKDHAEKAATALQKAGLPALLRLHPSASRSFFHGWEEEFSKAHQWFLGERDWPREIQEAEAPPPPPPPPSK
ncbi:MAG: hypothetical protein ACT4PV_09190 [Planctomycetaceae bacterium]